MAEISGLGFQAFFKIRPLGLNLSIAHVAPGVVRIRIKRTLFPHPGGLDVVMAFLQYFPYILGGLGIDFSDRGNYVSYAFAFSVPISITLFDERVFIIGRLGCRAGEMLFKRRFDGIGETLDRDGLPLDTAV